MPLPNIPLVNLTGAPQMEAPVQSGTTIAAAGQFANRIQRNAPRPNFINANGSSVTPPSTSQNGAQGSFGAMLPAQGVGGRRPVLSQQQIRTIRTPLQQRPVSTGYSTAALTGANNARYTYQGLYRPDAEQIRRQQITQLTAPYQGSIAALTGANMVEPTQVGFPGSDPRQPIPISNAAAGIVSNAAPAPVLETFTGSKRRKGYGGGGGGYGGSYGGGYGYGNSVATQILNWRVATG